MNNRILGTVSVAALVAANNVWAGSPEPAIVFAPPVVASILESPFNGFYAGGMVTSTNLSTTYSDSFFFDNLQLDASGIGGAVHGGYNFVLPSGYFYGGEVSYGFPNVTEDFGEFGELEMSSLASAQARFGYVAGPLMYYGLAGYAMADIEYGFSDVPAVPDSGYVVGVGVEYMVSSKLSVRGQYAYYDFGAASEEFSFEDKVGTADLSADATVLSVGLSYNF